MKPDRPTYDDYRALSAEERELIRLGDALAFANRELEPRVVPQRKPMTKTQLVAALAERAALDKAAAARALDALTGIVAGEVASYGSVTLPGLGKLAARTPPNRAREGADPSSGAKRGARGR